jgi:uncharacterized protein (DUF2267 family)
MDGKRFLDIVLRQIGAPREAAELAIRATLRSLAERISNEEAHAWRCSCPRSDPVDLHRSPLS